MVIRTNGLENRDKASHITFLARQRPPLAALREGRSCRAQLVPTFKELYNEDENPREYEYVFVCGGEGWWDLEPQQPL